MKITQINVLNLINFKFLKILFKNKEILIFHYY